MRGSVASKIAGLVGLTCLVSAWPCAAAPLTLAGREAAARATATGQPLCTSIAPFYWEIGDAGGRRVGASQGNASYTAATPMLVASASKWLFGAYLVQLRTNAQGVTTLSAADLKALHMQTGYSSLAYRLCLGTQTVAQCFHASSLLLGANDRYQQADDGAFTYDGGHFQKYAAVDLGLGLKSTGAQTVSGSLAQELSSKLGGGFAFSYDSPQLAGGVRTTPGDYAAFLRKLLNFAQPAPTGLRAGALLGQDAVCTRYDRVACPDAHGTPTPAGERWQYAQGHWVESDPKVGDGAFSSPGAFGFYPWIDAGKTWYGLLARQEDPSLANPAPYNDSVKCGRLIRKAWLTGVAQ